MGFQINIDTKDNKNFKQNHPIYLLQTASGRKAKMVGVMRRFRYSTGMVYQCAKYRNGSNDLSYSTTNR